MKSKIFPKKDDQYHESVMINEVVEEISHIKSPTDKEGKKLKESIRPKVIDVTLGTAGHAKVLMDAGFDVLGIEIDPKILNIAKTRIPEGKFVLGNFSEIDEIAKNNNFSQVDAILMDLGVSNLHLKNDERGFSFTEVDQALDMRLNPDVQGVTAADMVNALDKTQLTNLFARIMKYPHAKEVSEKIFENRPLVTVGDLKRVVYGIAHKPGLDAATLPMLALRVAVNSELENLKEGLNKGYELLKIGGKLLVITFHSGEDEIVRQFKKNQWERRPNEEEIYQNQKARSARLRIFTKS